MTSAKFPVVKFLPYEHLFIATSIPFGKGSSNKQKPMWNFTFK